MGKLMNAVIKYAESDKTKDADSEEDKADQNKKNGDKGSQSQLNKCRHDQNTSDLVANTNTGYQRQKQGGSNYRKTKGGSFRRNNFEAAMQAPCPTHSKPGRSANHTWEQCNFMKEFARRENQGPPESAGGADTRATITKILDIRESAQHTNIRDLEEDNSKGDQDLPGFKKIPSNFRI